MFSTNVVSAVRLLFWPLTLWKGAMKVVGRVDTFLVCRCVASRKLFFPKRGLGVFKRVFLRVGIFVFLNDFIICIHIPVFVASDNCNVQVKNGSLREAGLRRFNLILIVSAFLTIATYNCIKKD